MTDYIWQFGIDWNATEPTGVSYLRGGLSTKDDTASDGFVPSPGTEPVMVGDTVTFRLCDVTSTGSCVASLPYFKIFTLPAVKDQPADIDPWSSSPLVSPLQPELRKEEPPLRATVFGSTSCSWTSVPVAVANHPGRRFLLTVNVQAIGADGITRFFRLDPEMVVGANA